MLKILTAITLTLTLAVLPAHAAPAHSEAEVFAYRQNMRQAGLDLAEGRAETAFRTIRAAAEQGFAEAQYILATLYEDGEGTPADREAAYRWYQTAAANRDNTAVAALANEALQEWQH